MKRWYGCLLVLGLVVAASAGAADTGSLQGMVTDASGKALRGVMVSAFDNSIAKSVSVRSSPEGRFKIEDLEARNYTLRARLLGLEDNFIEDVTVKAGASNENALTFAMQPAEDMNLQRPPDNLFGLVKFDEARDKENFKMYCGYCHQIGTLGFRTPEEPVDWETMVSRMDGFGGLFEHTKETIVQRLFDAYSDEAISEWPDYVPPEAPSGKALNAVISEWDLGREDATMIHDLEVGMDGLMYAVDMTNDAIITLDPKTGERKTYGIPGGKDPEADGVPKKGPHSIEVGPKGNMWITLALSGQMAKFDVKTKEFTQVSGHPERSRGLYPHTLRVNQENGMVWYTDAGGGVYSLHPDTLKVTAYKLPSADQVSGEGRGESRGRTPYGIDIAPDGMVWYTKLNGNRIGRINPETGDIKEWNPPFRGPRRLHVAPNGIVWVPGFGSGVFGSFDPKTEEWDVIELPDALNQLPYALSIHPKTGDIWITGTGQDSMIRFNPTTKEMTTYGMPSRVTYTREVEFDEEGNIWLSNSNYPVRHTERHRGSIIKIALDD